MVVAVERSRPDRKMHRLQDVKKYTKKSKNRRLAGIETGRNRLVGWYVGTTDERHWLRARRESESSASRENGCKTNERPTMLWMREAGGGMQDAGCRVKERHTTDGPGEVVRWRGGGGEEGGGGRRMQGKARRWQGCGGEERRRKGQGVWVGLWSVDLVDRAEHRGAQEPGRCCC